MNPRLKLTDRSVEIHILEGFTFPGLDGSSAATGGKQNSRKEVLPSQNDGMAAKKDGEKESS